MPGRDAAEGRRRPPGLRGLAGPLAFAGVTLALTTTALLLFFPDPWSLVRRYWTLVPVAVLAASFANATGVGGGFLFVPFFLLSPFGLTAPQSLKLSLATQAFGMSSGAFGWTPRWILGRALLAAGVGGGLGLYLGTFHLPANALAIKAVFGWVSILAAVAVVLEMCLGREGDREGPGDASPLEAAGFLAACVAGGFLTAWASIGIGEVVALYLLLVHRLRIEVAIATGVAALAASSVLGLLFHAWAGGIPWEMLLFTAPGAAIGGRYGARLGRHVEGRSRRLPTPGTSPTARRLSPLKLLLVAVMVLDGVVMLLHAHWAD